ncbi:radical SAM protein [Paraburkholderia caribensis]|uniref:radical SAM protein n=1 Tax=Paraburkholderia caribensis TaxID=75105 RepID=UPI001CC7A5AB|nr:radical SAM protein [Paraburkholderia caribensis]
MKGHLLYIDITQICGIGCAFCMYADKHKSGVNMQLSPRAMENLAALINSPDVKRISVSGEGEPLNNIATFHQILGLSRGGKAFEFITSGFLPHDRLAGFYEETSALIAAKGDTCNIRLSSDSHHIDRIKHRPHGFSIRYLLEHQPSGLTFSFRSVDTDRVFTSHYLVDELAREGLDATIMRHSALEDRLAVGEMRFGIEYKNLVNPAEGTPAGYLELRQYIRAIEEKVQKRFTLGSLNKAPFENGMDVTVKPNGDVFFYGIESEGLGNLHDDSISWQRLAQRVSESALVRTLYTQPFMELVDRLKDDERAQTILKRVNNPYWVVKAMARHDGLLDRMIAS